MADARQSDRDIFKPKNTLERTPPSQSTLDNASEKEDGDSKNDETQKKSTVMDETQEIETDSNSDVEDQDDGQDGQDQGGPKTRGRIKKNQGKADRMTVKRLGSSAYKPFGSRSSNASGEDKYNICQGGSGEKEGTFKKCGKRVDDDDAGVGCDVCDYWFHVECQNVEPDTYEALRNIEGLFWICSKCRENLPDLTKKRGTTVEKNGNEASVTKDRDHESAKKDENSLITAIHAQKEELLAAMKQHEESIINNIKETLPKQTQPMKTYAEVAQKMEENVTKLQTAVVNTAVITEAVSEIKQSNEKQYDRIRGMEESMAKQVAQKEKENRAQNIIFHNIEESMSNIADERKMHDEEQFKNMMKKLMGDDRELKTERIIRLGRHDKTANKGRLMLVRLSCREDAEEIFRNRYRMREVGITNKYVSMDRTPDERKRYKELQKELEEKGDSFRIFRGRVVRRE